MTIREQAQNVCEMFRAAAAHQRAGRVAEARALMVVAMEATARALDVAERQLAEVRAILAAVTPPPGAAT